MLKLRQRPRQQQLLPRSLRLRQNLRLAGLSRFNLLQRPRNPHLLNLRLPHNLR